MGGNKESQHLQLTTRALETMVNGNKMQRENRWSVFVLALFFGGLILSACEGSVSASEKEPATRSPIEGTERFRVTLTDDAAKRLGIQTAPVAAAEGGDSGSHQTVIPFSAVVYQPDGGTWTYTNPQGLLFVPHRVSIDSVKKGMALLSDGPPVGTAVVTVGAAELLGVESGIGQ